MKMDLQADQLEQLSREKSVRGAVVRLARQRAAQASPEQQEILAQALELLLGRFQSESGDKP